MRLIVLYWLPVLLWAGLIFYFSSIPSLGSGLPWVWDFILRKMAHIAEYAVLTYLLGRALSAHRLAFCHVLIWSASLALSYAISDEYHQQSVEGRVGTPRDVAIDGVGILAAILYAKNNGRGSGH